MCWLCGVCAVFVLYGVVEVMKRNLRSVGVREVLCLLAWVFVLRGMMFKEYSFVF